MYVVFSHATGMFIDILDYYLFLCLNLWIWQLICLWMSLLLLSCHTLVCYSSCLFALWREDRNQWRIVSAAVCGLPACLLCIGQKLHSSGKFSCQIKLKWIQPGLFFLIYCWNRMLYVTYASVLSSNSISMLLSKLSLADRYLSFVSWACVIIIMSKTIPIWKPTHY